MTRATDLFIKLSDEVREQRLNPPDLAAGPVAAVLDTDTYNEIDDQFALAYALLSPRRIRLEAVYAAPFVNDHRSASPAEGMAKSHDEIYEVFSRLGMPADGWVHRGSERWLTEAGDSVPSAARDDLIERAMARDPEDPPLYVVAIGAPTNVASALLAEPQIGRRVVVVWLGGHPHYWHTASEFNLTQDPAASRVLFDLGVPLVHVPCINVAEKLRTTVAELERHLAGKNALCNFLLERFAEYERYEQPRKQRWNQDRPVAYAKELWDVATIAWLMDPAWAPGRLESAPELTQDLTWQTGVDRHLVRELFDLDRDAVFGDLFAALGRATTR